MDVQKNVKHLCLFLLFYSFTITSRIIHQGTVGWRDIIATAGYSLAMVIVFWYFLGKRKKCSGRSFNPLQLCKSPENKKVLL